MCLVAEVSYSRIQLFQRWNTFSRTVPKPDTLGSWRGFKFSKAEEHKAPAKGLKTQIPLANQTSKARETYAVTHRFLISHLKMQVLGVQVMPKPHSPKNPTTALQGLGFRSVGLYSQGAAN